MKPHELAYAIKQIRSRTFGPEVHALMDEIEKPDRPCFPSLPKGSLFITLPDILRFTAQVTGVPVDHIRSRTRKKNATTARRIYVYVATTWCPATREQTGKVIGKPHDAISYYFNGGGQHPSVQELYDTDKVFRAACHEVFDLCFENINTKR